MEIPGRRWYTFCFGTSGKYFSVILYHHEKNEMRRVNPIKQMLPTIQRRSGDQPAIDAAIVMP